MLILFCLVVAWGIVGAFEQAGTDARTGVRAVRNRVRQRAAVRAAQIRRRGWRSPARWALAAGMGAYRTGVYTRATYRGARHVGRSLRTGWVAGAQRGREKHAAYVARRRVRHIERAVRTEPAVRPFPDTRAEVRTGEPLVAPHRTDEPGTDPEIPQDSGTEEGAGEHTPTEEGTPEMPITSGGEALTYEQTQGTLKQMHDAATELVSTVDMLQASLTSADLDPQTLGEVAEILDAAQATQAAAQKALQGLESRHAHLHEAISTAPHVAQTDFYRD